MLHLGGIQDNWAPLGRGSAVERAIGSEGFAEPGDIIVAPEAWQYISSIGKGKKVGDAGHIKLEGTWPIADHQPLTKPKLTKQSERRLVSMSCPQCDSALPRARGPARRAAKGHHSFRQPQRSQPPDPLHEVHTIVGVVQEAILNVEGSINKLSVDEKGVSLLAIFGLPPLSHEKEADRAIAAALSIKESLAAHQVMASIGVTTGRALWWPSGQSFKV